MGSGAEAMPCLPAGDGTSHRLRPFRVQRQSKLILRHDGAAESREHHPRDAHPLQAEE